MIEQVVGVLYTVTLALKVPVVLAVLLALAWSLFESGWLLREWLERRRATRIRANAPVPAEGLDDAGLLAWLASDAAPELLRRGRRGVVTLDREELLGELELAAAGRLARLRVGLRLGPALGLMGTLIPMGPALMSISRGDLAAMSQDLIIAFGTTVVGLLVGSICYVMLVVRQQWYARDLARVERLVEGAAPRGRP